MLETLWVRFTHPKNGFTCDQEDCKKYLKLGKPYRVVRLYDISDWMVRVKIEDIGDKCLFNSVMFDFENNKMETISSREAFNAPQYEKYWYKDIV